MYKLWDFSNDSTKPKMPYKWKQCNAGTSMNKTVKWVDCLRTTITSLKIPVQEAPCLAKMFLIRKQEFVTKNTSAKIDLLRSMKVSMQKQKFAVKCSLFMR